MGRDLDLAYLAGVIDSDGHITINESTRKGRMYHGAVVGITGTRREPHDLASATWGTQGHKAWGQWNTLGMVLAIAWFVHHADRR